MATRYWPIIALAAIFVAAATVGTVYYANSLGASSGNGRLAVAVHDAPCTNCSHVWVTFTSVAVHASNASSNASAGGWTTLNVSGTTVDLAQLNGSAFAKVIGVATLKAGHYEQIRLTISKVVVVLADGSNLTARIPNATSANIHGSFDVHAGMTTTISIDIDLASSLHLTGGGPMLGAVFTPNIGSVVVV